MPTTSGLPTLEDIMSQLQGFELTPEWIEALTQYVTMVQLQTSMGQLDLAGRQNDLGMAQNELGFAEIGYKDREWQNRLRLDDLAYQTAQENRLSAQEHNAAVLEQLLLRNKGEAANYESQERIAAINLALAQERYNAEARGLTGKNLTVTPYRGESHRSAG